MGEPAVSVEDSTSTVEPASEIAPPSFVGELVCELFTPGVVAPGVFPWPPVVEPEFETPSLSVAELSPPGVFAPETVEELSCPNVVVKELASVTPSPGVEEAPSALVPPGFEEAASVVVSGVFSGMFCPLVAEEPLDPVVVADELSTTIQKPLRQTSFKPHSSPLTHAGAMTHTPSSQVSPTPQSAGTSQVQLPS